MIWTVVSLAVAAVSIGAAIGLGTHARSLAQQRDAARDQLDRQARDAARAAAQADTAATIAVRTLDARLSQTLDQLAELRATLARTTRERDDAEQLRQQGLEQLAALRAQLDAQCVSAADQERALRETIRQHDAQLATLTDRLGTLTRAHAESLVALAEAELALGKPARARDHAGAGARDAAGSPALQLRAQRAQVRALIQLRDPLALELALPTADRLRAEPSTPHADRFAFETLVVRAMLVRSDVDKARAASRAQDLLDWVIAQLGPDSPQRWQAESLLGEALTASARPARAAGVLTETLQAQLARTTLDDPDAQLTQVRLGEALIALDRSAEGDILLELVVRAVGRTSTSPVATRARAALDALDPAQPPASTRLASEADDPP